MPNIMTQTDSYKTSHFYAYPPGLTRLRAYLEARTGARYPKTLFFGLQAVLPNIATMPWDEEWEEGDVAQAAERWAAHGVPFNEAGWDYIREKHGGRLPLRIRAVAEGSLVPEGNVLFTVENTDPEVPWLVTWVETVLMRVWYGCTVATRSFYCKKVFAKYRALTSNDLNVDFSLHDFGARGVSSEQEACLGGMAHLVNFKGTDTFEAIEAANAFYGDEDPDEYKTYGFSIPAMEHSTVIAWGRDREAEAYLNMIDQSLARGHKMVACVSDSYDFRNAVENIWCGTLLEKVRQRHLDEGLVVVIRPDSGDAVQENLFALETIGAKAGCTKNSKGYRVLPPYFRLIQGDGNNNETDLERLCRALMERGWSTENAGAGMGAGLLRKVDRDTQRFAYKPSQAEIAGEWVSIAKNPLTDPTKASKGGNLDLLIGPSGNYVTVNDERVLTGVVAEDQARLPLREELEAGGYTSALETVFEDGEIKRFQTFDEIRDRAAAALAKEST